MEIKINIEKKHVYIIIATLLLIAGTGFVMAGFNPAFPWHPLQQITGNGTNSVDENSDGIIDKAENLTCTDCRLSGNLSVADMLGIGITNPTHKLHVNGSANITGTLYVGSGTTVITGVGVTADDFSCSGGDCIEGIDILESSLGTVPSATSASTATTASSANDLSCENCIGGPEIDESSLGTVPSATSANYATSAGSAPALNYLSSALELSDFHNTGSMSGSGYQWMNYGCSYPWDGPYGCLANCCRPIPIFLPSGTKNIKCHIKWKAHYHWGGDYARIRFRIGSSYSSYDQAPAGPPWDTAWRETTLTLNGVTVSGRQEIFVQSYKGAIDGRYMETEYGRTVFEIEFS